MKGTNICGNKKSRSRRVEEAFWYHGSLIVGLGCTKGSQGLYFIVFADLWVEGASCSQKI